MTVPLNPMTGQRTDLEVTKEDGAAAEKTHERWKALRVKYLESLIADNTTSRDARLSYGRELAQLRG